ncbi:MAG: response regulator transcription factor [Syntrophales bacterium]|nr:response regulator transcription factor [Syntrophales bacterium]MDD5641297.1 response regulator transcription factor [Syntrophales bacterium]
MQPYRLLIVDDHLIFREMITKSLDEITGLEVVGEACNSQEALELTKKLSPDMVILDIGMPHNSGLEVARTIKSSQPEIKILLLTMHKSKDHIAQSLSIGCEGYILKDNAFKDLVSAIMTIRQGQPYISNLVAQEMLYYLDSNLKLPNKYECLTSKEIEVLKHLCEGKSAKAIADSLSISKFTVENHIAKIKRKLSIKNTVNLIRYALSKGYSSLC